MPDQFFHDLQSAALQPAHVEVAVALEEVAQQCTHCGKCKRECLFLQEKGTPGQLAATLTERCARQGNQTATAETTAAELAYQCSLCGLCAASCPEDLEPDRMFLELRREAVRNNLTELRPYRRLLSYEKAGRSGLLRYSHLPANCDTVFFPGCALPAIRPDHVLRSYQLLQQDNPAMGIVLDCCLKPSHNLGRQAFFTSGFSQLMAQFATSRIQKIITVCTDCHQTFRQYAAPLEITSLYEELDRLSLQGLVPAAPSHTGAFTIHDPCTSRTEHSVHQAVRNLSRRSGVQVQEMKHNRAKTYCCGEGGSIGSVRPDYAASWSERRHAEAKGLSLITYCAGCTMHLSGNAKGKVVHLTDLIFGDNHPGLLNRLPARPPFTYLNRLFLKRKLRQLL